MVITPEQYADLQLESEDSLAQGFQTLSDMWADWLGKETVRVSSKQSKTLGKIWNMALTKMIAKIWLKWSTILVALFITTFWLAPRFLETLKHLTAKKKNKGVVQEPSGKAKC
jgi:hypothetical protein